MQDRNWESGLFRDRSSAEDAVNRLHEMGYQPDDISVMMSDRTQASEFAKSTGSKAAKGAATGATIGGGLGAIVAGLTATGSIAAIAGTAGAAAPLVAGPLAAALAGLGAGGLTGGIVGGLIGAGIPEHKAREYERGLNEGGIVVAVPPRTDTRDRLREVFPQDSYQEQYASSQTTSAGGSASTGTAGHSGGLDPSEEPEERSSFATNTINPLGGGDL